MMLSSRLRWPIWAALLVILGWMVATRQGTEQTHAIAEALPSSGVISRAPVLGDAEVPKSKPLQELIPRERLIASRPTATNLFAQSSWAPPPTAPTVTPPPAVTVKPPLPFVYLGKRRDDSGWQVYLGRGDLALVVREGDTIEGGYRVESIQPPNLTLFRADHRQQVAIGEPD